MNNIFAVAGVVIKELYRRKDFYVLFILTVLICLVMASVNFFNDDKIVRYLKEICLLFIWICSLVIAITTTARQIPAERENRTLFPLLAKPLTRTQLLLGKFLGCWLACGMALVCFYIFFGVLAASREHHWPLLNYFQAATLHWVMLAVVIAFALLGSLVFAAPSSNATISFVVRRIHFGAGQAPEQGRAATARTAPIVLTGSITAFPIWNSSTCGISSFTIGRRLPGRLRRGRPLRLAYARLALGAAWFSAGRPSTEPPPCARRDCRF